MKYYTKFIACQLVACFILSCIARQAQAQYNTPQNYNWVFGYKAALSFSTGAPVPFIAGQPHFPEGSATMSDAAGNLLFYTDGRRVYDRSHHLMMNGDSLSFMQTWSTICAATILPVPGNSNQYYIFSQEQLEFYTIPSNGRLSYSIVDMSLNSGLGGVLPTASGIMIDSTLTEKMVPIRGSNCNVWIVSHKAGSAIFSARSVSSAGISPAIVSATGTCIPGGFGCYVAGGMNASHDGRTIVTSGSYTELHDFDPATGIVSNSRTIDASGSYMMEFSPDDTKLYAGDYAAATLVQYNVALGTTAAITASKTVLATGYGLGGIKLGPDGKIYTPAEAPGYSLHRINYPNLAGTACGYTPAAVPLVFPYTRAAIGLPITNINFPVSVSISANALCVGGSLAVTPSVLGGTWASSSPSVATVNASGVVTAVAYGTTSISYTLSGCTAVATVSVVATPAPIGGGAIACVGHGNILSSASTGGTWSSASPAIATVHPATGIITGVAAGTAVISYTLPGGCPAVTTTVNIISSLPPILSTSTSVCMRDTLHLGNAIPGGVWESNVYFATVYPSSGLLTGMFEGFAQITYTLGFGCSVSQNFTINDVAPDAGELSGPATVCVTDTITVLAGAAGGSWAIAGTNASVDASGNVIGLTAGSCVVSYIVSNTCGSDTAFLPITVQSAAVCGLSVAGPSLNTQEDITVYPSPSAGLITLTTTRSFQNTTVTILDLLGETVLQRPVSVQDDKMSFDLTSLANGTYFVRIVQGNETIMKKVVLTK